jgi:hypothetical protein
MNSLSEIFNQFEKTKAPAQSEEGKS